MRIGITAVKATGMASIIFWLIILPEFNSNPILGLIPLSLIPIFLCCLFTIVFTIYPFFWFADNSKSPLQIVKRFFPYYAITVCFICCFSIHVFNYELFAVAFFTSAFFTLLQTWLWTSKTDSE